MQVANPYAQYQKNAINSADPAQLTLMLYNGAVKFTKQAISEMQASNIEKSNHYNLRAQDIITELMLTLNHDYEISKNLHSLYDYIKHRLIEANIKKDSEILHEALGLLEELRNTWAEALKKAKATAAEG